MSLLFLSSSGTWERIIFYRYGHGIKGKVERYQRLHDWFGRCKTVRDELSKFLDMVNVIKKLSNRIDIARSELESVRELNTDSEISILEDKIKDLEKRNAELDLEISEYTGTTEMFREMMNGLKNENKTIIREDVRTAVEESNRKILDEIKL
ncbi:hypothetical protein AVEN_166776-1 [Araneus ventricosus]|uniref:Uncharacterized protein n=1 Tax=Araneus ventricosus TaxID=182803 RepID=A0A4Y2BR30_ARAVE|nr:hypothetical protein AVEN_166776-1 [Araneus ventricosus]